MAQKRKRRTKAEIEASKVKSEGLGDTIEKVFEATGIDKLAKFVLGEDCNCDKRKEKLNKWFPYRKPNCLTEQEYQWLDNYYNTVTNLVTQSQIIEFVKIYNRVFNDKKQPTNCDSCFRSWHAELKKVYESYENTNDTI